MRSLDIDLDKNPNMRFRIDNFSVPAVARDELIAAMRRNAEFLRTLPGFLGHVAFEKTHGSSAFDIVTIAAWESEEAIEKAGAAVRAYYQRIGFDPAAAMARWGVRAERADYAAPSSIQ